MKSHNKPVSHGATLAKIEKIDKSQIPKAHLKRDTLPTLLCPVCPYFFLGTCRTHTGHILFSDMNDFRRMLLLIILNIGHTGHAGHAFIPRDPTGCLLDNHPKI
jgi:hypothetical protein